MRPFRVALAAAAVASPVPAADWPRFRGPAGTGVVADGDFPTTLGKDSPTRWKVEVPGSGWSSPVVVGDKVFVTTAVSAKGTKPQGGFGGGRPGGGRPPGGGGGGGRGGMGRPAPDDVYKWQVLCLGAADGKVVWSRTAAEKKPATSTHSTNTYASETPVVDGDRLYAYFGMTGVYCYDLAGKKLWEKDLGSFPMQNGWGTGSSPAAVGGKLFVLCDNEKQSFLVALDGKTGEELWRKDRPGRSSWSTPFVWAAAGRTDVVCCGDGKVVAYAPADGKVVWELGGVGGTFSSSPAADGERLYFGTGSGSMGPGPLYAVKAGAAGDVTPKKGESSSASVAWVKTSSGPRMASPLAYKGCLYVADQRGGTLACYDAATGKEHYKERLPKAKGFTASPWAAGGKVFVLDDGGRTFVLAAGPEFKLLDEGSIDEMCWSTPAAANGAVYVRGRDHLYCFADKK